MAKVRFPRENGADPPETNATLSLQALMKLGLSNDMVTTEVVNSVLSKPDEYKLPFGQYTTFWAGLQKPHSATFFLKELITALINTEKQYAKAQKKANQDALERRLLQIVNTIDYISHLYDVDVKNAIFKKALRNWEAHEEDAGIPTSPASDVMQNLIAWHISKGDFSHSLVVLCCTVCRHQSLIGEHLSLEAACNGDTPFRFIQFQNELLKRPSQAKHIFDTIFRIMTRVPPQIRIDSVIAESTALALLYMFKEALGCHPFAYGNYLEDAAYTVIQPFMSWPQPTCNVAQLALDMMSLEVQAPGTVMRQRIYEENPVLGPLGADVQGDAEAEAWAANQRSVSLYVSPTAERYTLLRHFLLNQNSVLGGSISAASLAAGAGGDEEEDDSTPALMKQLLFNILETNLDAGNLFENKCAALERCIGQGPTELEKWYRRATQICDSSLDMVPPECTEWRVQELTKMVEAMLGGGASGAVAIKPKSWAVQELLASQAATPGSSGFGNATEQQIAEAEDAESRAFVCQCVPTMPHLKFNLHTLHPSSGQTMTGKPNGGATSSSSAQHSTRLRFVSNTADWNNFLAAAQAAAVPASLKAKRTASGQSGGSSLQLQSQPVLRVVSAGDNAALHRILVCYVALRHHHPQLFAEIELRIYVVPLGRSNDLCRFVAMHDGWYRREIFAPFFADSTLMPRLQPGTEQTAATPTKQAAAANGISSKVGPHSTSDSSSRMDTSSLPGTKQPSLPMEWDPGSIQPRLLQAYVRGAQEKIAVNVYQCECWRPDNRDDEPDCVVPFVSRLEVGLETNIRQFQEEHPEMVSAVWLVV
jgi:hypothetical protein